MWCVSLVVVLMGFGVIGCSQDASNPAGPSMDVEAEAAANYYTVGGDLGEIAGYIEENEFVINLTAGVWKISYTVEGHVYELVVNLESEQRVYVGTHARATYVAVEQGQLSPTAKLQGLVDMTEWLSVGNIVIIIIQDGQVVTAIILSEEYVHPQEIDVPVVEKTPTATCLSEEQVHAALETIMSDLEEAWMQLVEEYHTAMEACEGDKHCEVEVRESMEEDWMRQKMEFQEQRMGVIEKACE